MFKNFVSIAAVAIVLASCTQEDLSSREVNVTTSESISLDPSTAITRAAMATLGTLQASQDGFVVYATSGAAPSGWVSSINGTNNHVYNASGKWGFKTAVAWPTSPNEYPMNFYALYPKVPNNAAKSLSGNYQNLSMSVVIPNEVVDQVDLLATKNKANSKPFSSSLGLGFKHILSKVDFSVSNTDTTGLPSANQHAFVLAVGFKNLYSTNTYNIIDGVWGTVAPATGNYNYYNSFVSLRGTSARYTEKEFVGANKTAFFTSTDAHMMLMPQTANFWPGSTDYKNLPQDDEAYIRVFYRVSKETGSNPAFEDLIGYAKATSHPGYESSQLKADNYEGPLYVLVGFKYANEWKMGTGYKYDIPLPGKTGGRLLDENLYDDQGNRTDLEAGGEKGTTVVSEDEDIHLIPSVNPWDDLSPIDVIGQ